MRHTPYLPPLESIVSSQNMSILTYEVYIIFDSLELQQRKISHFIKQTRLKIYWREEDHGRSRNEKPKSVPAIL